MTLTGHTPVSRRATHRLPRWWGKGVEAMLVVQQTSRAFPEKRDKTMAVATQPPIDVHDNSLAGARAWFAQKGLSRPREGRLLAGVSAGFARRYDINPLVARLLAILGVVVLSPLLYVAAWVLMPNEAGGTPAGESPT
jgi:phage shock protein PspC (stress-responsive transcriptional regulator)